LEILCQHALWQYEYAQNDDIRYLLETGLQKINPDNLGTMMKSTMSFKNIEGMESIKKSLLTSILGPLKHPLKFSRFGLKNVSGILLYGASGCAKTTIVKCLAGESKMTLLSVSSAEIYSPSIYSMLAKLKNSLCNFLIKHVLVDQQFYFSMKSIQLWAIELIQMEQMMHI